MWMCLKAGCPYRLAHKLKQIEGTDISAHSNTSSQQTIRKACSIQSCLQGIARVLSQAEHRHAMLQESHEALSEQATSLSRQVEELKDQLASLQSSAAAAEQQVSSLQEQLATETAANKAHQETVERQTEELQVYCQPLTSFAVRRHDLNSLEFGHSARTSQNRYILHVPLS